MTSPDYHARLPRAYRGVVRVLRPFLRTVQKRDWHGTEHFPTTGGFVVSPNHVSYWDPMALGLFMYESGHPAFFLGKEAMFKVPVLGRVILATGQIPVYRESGRAADAFRAAVAAVREGRCVAILPDGTLTRDPDLWPMRGKTGAARVALLTRCPLIPMAQWGPQEVLPPYTKRLRLFPRKTMHMRAGPPVDLSDLYDRPLETAVLREATDRLMAAITALLEQVRGETAPAVRYDPRAHGVPEIGNPNAPKASRPAEDG